MDESRAEMGARKCAFEVSQLNHRLRRLAPIKNLRNLRIKALYFGGCGLTLAPVVQHYVGHSPALPKAVSFKEKSR